MSNKRFVLVLLLIVSLALTTVGLFNLLIDPLGAYQSMHLKGFERFRFSVGTRPSRAELARRGDWQMIILGTSRPKIGFSSGHPYFVTNRACNLSLDGGRMSELALVFDYTRERNPLQHVLLCLDFSMFREGARTRADFDTSRFGALFSPFHYHSRNILGFGTAGRSWEFLVDRLRGRWPPEDERNGFAGRVIKATSTHRNLFQRTMRSLAYGYAAQRPDAEQLADFHHVLRVCLENDIQLTLAATPVHALDSELVRAGGNWERLEQWKRDLVRVIADEGATDRVLLWDFSGYNSVTTEEIPPAGDTTRMKYYVEHSHFLPPAGDLMVDRMFGDLPLELDFGRRLTPENIEEHLESIRVQREAYAQTHSDEIQWVQKTSQEVLASRKYRPGDEALLVD